MECKIGGSKPMFVLQTYEDRLAHKELSQKLSERLSNLTCNDQHGERLPTLNNRQQINGNNPPPPPPPPPLENGAKHEPPPPPSATDSSSSTRSNTLKPHKTKPKAPPVPVKYSVLSYTQPPPCPTPDYDTLSISSSISNNNSGKNVNHSVEMRSLDSFRMNNPAEVRPKPPSTYFQKRQLSAQSSNGSVASVGGGRKQRPVSVTIGEYPSMRRQPGRLDFLQNSTEEVGGGKQPITSQLASELTQTLNRSNLRKRTESMENLLGCPQIKPQSNGSVRISLTNGLYKNFAKSTSDLTADYERTNRVMINVNQDKKTDSPSGILKNSTNTPPSSANHKPLVQQKSITFGEM